MVNIRTGLRSNYKDYYKLTFWGYPISVSGKKIPNSEKYIISVCYYKDPECLVPHRDDGPAVQRFNSAGHEYSNEYWLNGNHYSKFQWTVVNKLNDLKDTDAALAITDL
jgi:hypothetical protein